MSVDYSSHVTTIKARDSAILESSRYAAAGLRYPNTSRGTERSFLFPAFFFFGLSSFVFHDSSQPITARVSCRSQVRQIASVTNAVLLAELSRRAAGRFAEDNRKLARIRQAGSLRNDRHRQVGVGQ